MSRHAFAVSSGSYDTYEVHLIAPTRAMAETIAAQLNDGQSWPDFVVEAIPMVDSVEDVRVIQHGTWCREVWVP